MSRGPGQIQRVSKSELSVEVLVGIIFADLEEANRTGRPKTYQRPSELAEGERLMGMLMPNGKALGECTFAEVGAIEQAYRIIGMMTRSAWLRAAKGRFEHLSEHCRSRLRLMIKPLVMAV